MTPKRKISVHSCSSVVDSETIRKAVERQADPYMESDRILLLVGMGFLALVLLAITIHGWLA